MNELEQASYTLTKFWPVLVSIVLLVAWFVRLEARQFFHDKDFARYQKDMNGRMKEQNEKIKDLEINEREILTTLSKMEGKLGGFK